MLSALNAVWNFIESFNASGATYRPLPRECRAELLRFLGMLPLVRMNFRLDMDPMVTCSDASTSGGGICCSVGLSAIGAIVEKGGVRGEVPQPLAEHQVLVIGLFDGIGALRVAVDLQNLPVCGYISVERNKAEQRVVEAHYPGVWQYDDVELIIEDVVKEFGCAPVLIDGGSLTWCHRPRLYWTTWELAGGPGADLCASGEVSSWKLSAAVGLGDMLEPGWWKNAPNQSFPTFTTSRPSATPGRKPAGIGQCDEDELRRWREDQHRFPPYQYQWVHGLSNKHGIVRVPSTIEREVLLGFPAHYTAACAGKSERKSAGYNDTRLTLLGNTWCVPVIALLLNQLLFPLGLALELPPQRIMDLCRPAGGCDLLQGRLVRLPVRRPPPTQGSAYNLAFKLGNLISLKGEDILLSTPSTQLVRFHRLRASVPSRLWKWKIVAGWTWVHGKEHINSLELRAILNSIRWRIEHQGHTHRRMIHLTDSLVCLHAMTRGRTSSRKLRSTMARISALLLCSNSQFLWGYVRADSNPADKPSRWGRKVRTRFRNAYKRMLEGSTQEERAAIRRRMGTLRQLTVQPATRRRYDKAIDRFLDFLKKENMALPTNKTKLDPIVCDYLEVLWSTGEGRGLACDTLAGLQDLQPGLRNNLPTAWRLLKTWRTNEIPNRAPPMAEHIVHAMCGWALFNGWNSFALSLLIGFYSMLRTGEIF